MSSPATNVNLNNAATAPAMEGAPEANQNNPTTETCRGGPRTEEGRATSSKNAITNALFTYNDFVLPGEEDTYVDFVVQLNEELKPVGLVEEGLVDEIRRAMWRLRRCGNVERELALSTGADSMRELNSDAEKTQKSIDRARAQANRLRKQAMAELRQLQTERRIREEIFPDADTADLGVVDSAKVLQATIAAKRNAAMEEKQEQEEAFARFDKMFSPPKAA